MSARKRKGWQLQWENLESDFTSDLVQNTDLSEYSVVIMYTYGYKRKELLVRLISAGGLSSNTHCFSKA